MVSRERTQVAIISARLPSAAGPGCRDALASLHMAGELPKPNMKKRASINPEHARGHGPRTRRLSTRSARIS